jgi:formylglycine-generating enzyme
VRRKRPVRRALSTLGALARREAIAWHWVLGMGGAAAVLWAALFGTRARQEPERCAPGMRSQGARCCPEGQRLEAGQCRGQPHHCPPGLQLELLPQPGCAAAPERAWIAGGTLKLAPSDWESEGIIEARTLEVDGFELDRTEVTSAAWHRCVTGGACEPVTTSAAPAPEPGVPVTHVTPRQAAHYCAFVGGRLPSFDELLFAAAGSEGRRFPWGPHGLVCRRAAFGLFEGPCGRGTTGPEIAGSRPDGATPEGIVDLVGNVAEWTHDAGGALRLFGGSYRSKGASRLKSWSSEPPRIGNDVGFRCAYDGPSGRNTAR